MLGPKSEFCRRDNPLWQQLPENDELCARPGERVLTRIAKRVQVGGHDVPEADVRPRYVRSFRNLPMAFRIADSTRLFDNSEDVGFRPVGICHNAEQRWFDPLPVWAAELSVAASKRANR